MGVKMNFRIITKNHAADPEIRFLTKSISKPFGRATAMPPAWETKIFRLGLFWSRIFSVILRNKTLATTAKRYSRILWLSLSKFYCSWFHPVRSRSLFRRPKNSFDVSRAKYFRKNAHTSQFVRHHRKRVKILFDFKSEKISKEFRENHIAQFAEIRNMTTAGLGKNHLASIFSYQINENSV